MKVKCPGCKGAYKVDDNKVQEKGLKMRCPSCKTAFLVRKKPKSRAPTVAFGPSDPNTPPKPHKDPLPSVTGDPAVPPKGGTMFGQKLKPPLPRKSAKTEASPPKKGSKMGPAGLPPLKKKALGDKSEIDFSDIGDDLDLDSSAAKGKTLLGQPALTGSETGLSDRFSLDREEPDDSPDADPGAGLDDVFSIDEAIDASFSKRAGETPLGQPGANSIEADVPYDGDEEFDLTSQIPDEPYGKIELPPRMKKASPPEERPDPPKDDIIDLPEPPAHDAPKLSIDTIDLPELSGNLDLNRIDTPEESAVIPASKNRDEVDLPDVSMEPPPPIEEDLDSFQMDSGGDFDLSLPEDDSLEAGLKSERSSSAPDIQLSDEDLERPSEAPDIQLSDDDLERPSEAPEVEISEDEFDLTSSEIDELPELPPKRKAPPGPPVDFGKGDTLAYGAPGVPGFGDIDLPSLQDESSDIGLPEMSEVLNPEDVPRSQAPMSLSDDEMIDADSTSQSLPPLDIGIAGTLPPPDDLAGVPSAEEFGDISSPADLGAPGPDLSDIPGPDLSDIPSPAGFDDIPSPADFSDIPGPDLSDIPGPDLSDIPGPADAGGSDSGLVDFGDIPSPADLTGGAPSKGTQRIIGSGSTDFGEISLSPGMGSTAPQDALAPELDAGEFDDFPTESASRRADPGLDLAEDPLDLRLDHTAPEETDELIEGAPRPAMAFEGRRKWERQSRRTKVILLVALVLVVAAGSALSFTSFGPFGAHFLFRLLPKPIDKNAVEQAKKTINRRLQEDNVTALSVAIKEAREASDEWTGSDDLRLMTVYICYFYQVRFDEDKMLDHHATRYLGATKLDESESLYAPLAKVAQFLRFSRPIKMTAPWAAALRKTPNGQAALAEVYLRQNAVDKAITIARELDQKEKSSRSGYLLARALLEKGGNRKTAVERLTRIAKTDPKHLDSVLLLGNAMLDVRPFDAMAVRGFVERVLKPADNVHPTEGQRAEAHAVLARLLIIERQYAEAEKAVAASEKINPENVSMLLSKGRIALLSEKYSEAATIFNRATANAPENIDAKLGKIETNIRIGELSNAKKALTALAPEHPNNPRARFLMGEVNLSLKKAEPAETELKKALELDDKLLEAYIALSTLYISQKKNKQAMEILDKASEKVPGSPLIKKTLAKAHAARGDFGAAIIELDKALSLAPDDVGAHFMMAQMYRKMGSLEDAHRSLDEAAKRDPSFPGLAMEQGLLMELSGEVAKALAAYKTALAASPNDVSLKLRVGAAAQIIGELSTAKKMLTEVLDERPDSAEAHFYYGETLRVDHKSTEAIPSLKRACLLEDENPRYHLRYGMALADIGESGRALDQLKRALQLDENLAEAYIRMGQIRLKRGAPRDAIYLIEKGLELDSNFVDGFVSVAEAFDQLGNHRSAMYYYKKAAAQMKNDSTIHFRLGLSELMVLGEKVAVQTLSRAVSLASQEEEAPNWLPEALYRLGVAYRKLKRPHDATNAFRHYLRIAPEGHIDRNQVLSYLDELAR